MEAARQRTKPPALLTGDRMENLLVALAVVTVSFFAGFQARAVISQRRRRRQRGF
jgi:hypothetical protein